MLGGDAGRVWDQRISKWRSRYCGSLDFQKSRRYEKQIRNNLQKTIFANVQQQKQNATTTKTTAKSTTEQQEQQKQQQQRLLQQIANSR